MPTTSTSPQSEKPMKELRIMCPVCEHEHVICDVDAAIKLGMKMVANFHDFVHWLDSQAGRGRDMYAELLKKIPKN